MSAWLRAAGRTLNHGSEAASYFLGGIVVVTALVVMAQSTDATDIAGWAFEVLGLSFLVLLGSLVFATLFAWVRLQRASADDEAARDLWLEVGVQAANGVTTLALTYTLLGISLGIGSLAGQDLTPQTVQAVIRDLTANFSLAFMTTVVGLPTSALLRGLLVVTRARQQADAAQNIVPPKAHVAWGREEG
jgi:hypothetical protein